MIVMDPPWENASARRRGAYATLPARQLLRVPVADLLHEVGGVYNQHGAWGVQLCLHFVNLPCMS
jgi:hypothetical protein